MSIDGEFQALPHFICLLEHIWQRKEARGKVMCNVSMIERAYDSDRSQIPNEKKEIRIRALQIWDNETSHGKGASCRAYGGFLIVLCGIYSRPYLTCWRHLCFYGGESRLFHAKVEELHCCFLVYSARLAFWLEITNKFNDQNWFVGVRSMWFHLCYHIFRLFLMFLGTVWSFFDNLSSSRYLL